MNIVVLTSRFPYPIEKGDKLRIYHQLKFLSKIHKIHLVSISHDKVPTKDILHLETMCESVLVIKMSRIKSIVNTVFGFFNTLPFQVNFFFSKSMKRKIDLHVKATAPDVIYCQLIRMTEYMRDLPYPKVLDYMDAFSMNYTRRIEHENPIGKFFFTREARRLRQYEYEVFSKVDNAVIISENDRNQIGVDKGISVISNGLDTAYFRSQETDPNFDIIFVGNMGYHPNILAAKFLVQDILPLLKSELKVQIAGARPSKGVKELEGVSVKVSGWVDDIRNAYASSKLFVAPIFSGAGQQNKILEAMSMELICITTSMVNESIQAEVGKEILIANNAKEFANQIEKVTKNMKAYEKIGANARKFVMSNFSWENENHKLNEILVSASKESKNEV